MRRFLLQLHCMTIGILFLFFYSCCFALDSDRYPWYFIPNGIKECWNDMGPTSRGEGALIDILDTKIKFVSILKGKEFFSKNYNSPCPRSLNAEEELHGTAMAGLIAADHERLVCVEVDKDLCDIDGKIMVAGIAPEAKIISREWIPEGDLVKTVASSLDKRTPTNRHGKKIRFDDLNASETKLILLSLSAGIQTRDAKDIQEKIDNWLTKIQPEVRDNPYFLIIAAVGNIGGEFKERTYGYIPAIVPASKAGRDVIIRVGAITQYNSTVSPKVHRNSRCGKDYVDIMAPGQTIPALTPSANATILSGTSEATAIVSGAAALLAACNPSADANDIRQALLNNSDVYKELEEAVNGGRVLNIYKMVDNYCKTREIPAQKVNIDLHGNPDL